MYRKQRLPQTTLRGILPYKGESIERKVSRVKSNNEPIKDQAPLTYTDRKDGVLPDFDMRTDKWEYLVEGHDALAKSKRAKRDTVPDTQTETAKENTVNTETGGQSTQTT